MLNLIKKIDKEQGSLKMTSGEQEVNFVFIDDVVMAYVIAAENLITGNERQMNLTYSVRSKETITLRELVNLYEKVNKTVLDIKWGEKPHRKREMMFSWSKGEILPGWDAEINLEEGLRLLGECE